MVRSGGADTRSGGLPPVRPTRPTTSCGADPDYSTVVTTLSTIARNRSGDARGGAPRAPADSWPPALRAASQVEEPRRHAPPTRVQAQGPPPAPTRPSGPPR